MPHQTPLITTIVIGLGLAFIFGALANRLRLSPLAGYLVAGVIIGPFTPGYVADQAIASQLAELGIILLMFGVGLHFSLRDLLSVRAIAISGAMGQMIFVALLGTGLAHAMGWSTGAGVVFGLALSVASTVVVLRALQEKRLIQTEWGRITVGWLIVEDIAMILALILLPVLAGSLGGQNPPAPSEHQLFAFLNPHSVAGAFVLTFAKIATFVIVMLVVGRRVVPWVLHYAAHTGSRELFRLAVLSLALGVAFGSAELFGVSFALGAFFGGMILAESQLSHQAAQETLPLRDAFAVLFFVSVGMLFDPSIVVREPMATAATFLIIVLGNTLAAFLILSAFGHPFAMALPLAVSLSQIGEFSFILAGLGVQLQLLPENGRDLILAGAILSILANPVLSFVLDKAGSRLQREQRTSAEADALRKPELPVTSLTDHAVLVGYGRVGSLVGQALEARSYPFLVIEERQDVVHKLRSRGIEAIAGAAAQPGLLAAANLAGAKWLISAIPNPFEAGNLIEQARAASPALEIIARAHSDAEIDYLKGFGANLIIMGEQEIARAITEHIMMRLDNSNSPEALSSEERSTAARQDASW
jgi:monovalent cation:H+ antiporter-2, CPA2 family